MLHVAVLVTVSLEPTAPRPTVDLVQVTPAPPRTTNFAAPPRKGAELAAEAERGAAARTATVARIPAAFRVMRCIVVPLVYLRLRWNPSSQDHSDVIDVKGAFASGRNKGSNTVCCSGPLASANAPRGPVAEHSGKLQQGSELANAVYGLCAPLAT